MKVSWLYLLKWQVSGKANREAFSSLKKKITFPTLYEAEFC